MQWLMQSHANSVEQNIVVLVDIADGKGKLYYTVKWCCTV